MEQIPELDQSPVKRNPCGQVRHVFQQLFSDKILRKFQIL